MGIDELQFDELTEKRFGLLFKILRIGILSIYTRNVSKIRTFSIVLICLSNAFVYFGGWLDVIIHSGDFKHIMKTLRITMPVTFILWTEMNFRLRRDVYENLIEQTKYFSWDELPEKDSNTGKLTAAGWIIRIHKIMKHYMIFNVIIYCIHSTVRLIASRELLYQVWYPFDMSQSPTFEIVYATQVMASIQWAVVYFGFLYLYILCICIACTQLDIVKHILLHIQWNNNLCTEDTKCLDTQQETYCGIQKNINGCVRLHQEVIRFLNQLDNAVSLPLGAIFLFLQITLCISAFAFVVSWGDTVDLILAVQTYIMSLSLVAIYCCVGTILTEKYESVRDAAWASDWVGAPISHQRSLFLIITQANRKFTLTSGKFIPVSNTTMSNMLNESMSLFMFLLTMKDKNDETM